MDPKNGTVAYDYAKICAKLLKLSDQFVTDYSCMEGYRVDVGEFNYWALNLLGFVILTDSLYLRGGTTPL